MNFSKANSLSLISVSVLIHLAASTVCDRQWVKMGTAAVEIGTAKGAVFNTFFHYAANVVDKVGKRWPGFVVFVVDGERPAGKLARPFDAGTSGLEELCCLPNTSYKFGANYQNIE